MWTVALGLGLLLQAGAVQVECPAGRDCAAETGKAPELPAHVADPPSHAPARASQVSDESSRSAFATVSFRNDVGKKLRLVEARFTMDGADVPTRLTNVEPGKSYVVVSGHVAPGPHVMRAHLTYQGDRRVFSYMSGYKVNVKADHVLTAPADRAVSFTVVSSENKGMTVPLDKRVVITVEEAASKK
jgi:hypothetical protein